MDSAIRILSTAVASFSFSFAISRFLPKLGNDIYERREHRLVDRDTDVLVELAQYFVDKKNKQENAKTLGKRGFSREFLDSVEFDLPSGTFGASEDKGNKYERTIWVRLVDTLTGRESIEIKYIYHRHCDKPSGREYSLYAVVVKRKGEIAYDIKKFKKRRYLVIPFSSDPESLFAVNGPYLMDSLEEYATRIKQLKLIINEKNRRRKEAKTISTSLTSALLKSANINMDKEHSND